MAAVASLQAELRSLGSSSKRHNVSLSQSSDKALSILEAVSQSYDNDQSIIPCLRKYEDFVTPFILACSEASAKSCASALQCIQTLATYKAIAPSRLSELLRALMEATQLGLAIQLKILQVLPVILFEFSADLTGDQVVELLQVCSELLGGNKVAMVHNAAYATLQQLITGVFDRTDISNADDTERQQLLVVDEATQFQVSPPLHDAAMVWLDLCDIAEKRPARFLKIKDLPLTFTLELLELTLSNQAALIHRHEELVSVLRTRVIPLLLRLFSESSEFSLILRVVRVFYLLLRQHLNILETESEVILATVAQGSLQGQIWKRVVCLEVLQGVLMDVDLFFQIYTKFDGEQGRLNVMQTITTDFAAAVCENDRLVLASDMSKESYEHALSLEKGPSSLQLSATATNSGDDSAETVNDASMLLTKSAATNIPVIEMLDRADPPKIKRAHPYYLIVKCMNSLADDIHRLAALEKVNISSILRTLGTPILKSFSVILGLAMDLELFRLVVRSAQRMAHASGIASSRELRDDFILLLTQYCYISDDTSTRSWNLGRCSLCVRALFNLGYALGNQLEKSWGLIASTIFKLNKQIESDQGASFDCLFGISSPEYRNMNTALRKMIESTSHHSDSALIFFMNALTTSAGEDDLLYILLQCIVHVNLLRFGDPDTKCWIKISEILINGIARNDDSIALRVLNEASLDVMQTVATSDLEDADVDKTLAMVLKSICGAIKVTQSDSTIEEIQHLNMLIDKFGGKLSTGWEDVFSVVSEIPATNELELMRSAFRTLELICSDFLEKLPYPCIFNLTLCLNEYSRQTLDLNTSFTSTSLFWSVCDHLMAGPNVGKDLDASEVDSEEKLIAIARDYSSESKKIALWLFAVTKLASISEEVDQQQVRISAIQIFLRLFNTHGSRLPLGAWNIAHTLIFPILLNSVAKARISDRSELQELYILVINGISRLNGLFLSKSSNLEHIHEFWKLWIQFLDNATKISAPIAMTVYSNLRALLESEFKNSVMISSVSNFWAAQNTLPEYSSSAPKPTSDSLRELVKLYEAISDACEPLSALRILTECALFPYYTISASSSHMSLLQEECVKCLEGLKTSGDPKLSAEHVLSLNRLATSPYVELNEKVDSYSSPNFNGLSEWALNRLSTVIETLRSSSQSELREEVVDVLPSALNGMNLVSRLSKDQILPMKVTLQLLDLAPDMNRFKAVEIVDSIRLVLSGFNSHDKEKHDTPTESDVISIINTYVSILKAKAFTEEGWSDILETMLNQSVVYEKSVHNLKYYEQKDPSLEAALMYGTIDVPKMLHNQTVAFSCLALLRSLGCEHEVYSNTAISFFLNRVRAVLCQYIGDCRILGQEPLRGVIRDELSFVLSELTSMRSEHREMIDDKMHKLVLKTISSAHREVLPLLQDILQD